MNRGLWRWRAGRFLLAGAVFGGGLALGLLGCTGASIIETVTNPPTTPVDTAELVRKFVDAHGKNRFVYDVGVRDPDGYFIGKVSLQGVRGTGTVVATSAAFRQAKIAGRISTAADNVIHLKALAVVSAKAGSYCLSLSANSDPRDPNHVFPGRFSVIGGTGKAARLHASGPLLAIESQQNYNPNRPGPVKIVAAATTASIGGRRGLTGACRAAMKPPKPLTKISASLDGFAFAPAGRTTLPPGTTIYPNNSTISGSVGCGADNTLYIVISYTGPKGGTLYVAYLANSGSKGGPQPTPLGQGQNAVPLISAPPNDTYRLAQAFVTVVTPQGATGQTSFTGSITLTRNC